MRVTRRKPALAVDREDRSRQTRSVPLIVRTRIMPSSPARLPSTNLDTCHCGFAATLGLGLGRGETYTLSDSQTLASIALVTARVSSVAVFDAR
jgi:hypothetical protein